MLHFWFRSKISTKMIIQVEAVSTLVTSYWPTDIKKVLTVPLEDFQKYDGLDYFKILWSFGA